MKEAEKTEDGRHLRAMKTRYKIINSARHVFLREGFQNTTIKQIIEHAQIGYGTAYSHFDGKDDILIFLMEDVMKEFFEIAHTPFFPSTREEAKEIILGQILRFLKIAETERDIMKVFSEGIGISPIANEKWEDIRQGFIQSITKDITYSQRNGLARTDLKAEIAARMWFYANEMYQWEIVFEKNKSPMEEIAETIVTIYVDAIYL
ncbi:TetR/AcrR family transcriptional regulator [Bacillus sp. JJ1562]|uniref:TetR/AcrR family transcriptional regulator n=1 Tax=Bacillus sp. JJ1562 TaxID=3122960 RepID=UPI003002AB60